MLATASSGKIIMKYIAISYGLSLELNIINKRVKTNPPKKPPEEERKKERKNQGFYS